MLSTASFRGVMGSGTDVSVESMVQKAIAMQTRNVVNTNAACMSIDFVMFADENIVSTC